MASNSRHTRDTLSSARPDNVYFGANILDAGKVMNKIETINNRDSEEEADV